MVRVPKGQMLTRTFTKEMICIKLPYFKCTEKKVSGERRRGAKGANYLDDHGRLVIMMMKLYSNLENYRLRLRLFLRNNDSFACLRGKG